VDRKQDTYDAAGIFPAGVFEVLEASDEKDANKLREELGDLLLHIVLQAQIAQEAANIIDDVIRD